MRVYNGRVPTDIPVNKLVETFTNLRAGVNISHDEIAGVIDAERGTSRHQSVVHAWRKRLRDEKGVELGAVRGVGFVVLSASERVRGSAKDIISGLRKVRRGAVRAQSVNPDDLDDDDKARRMHLLTFSQDLIEAGNTGCRRFERIGSITDIERVKKLKP